MPDGWVQVAEVPEAGVYAGRVGHVNGWSSLSGAPDSARGGPVVGAQVGGSDSSDIVYGVWFDDTGEVIWFSPHLLLDTVEP